MDPSYFRYGSEFKLSPSHHCAPAPSPRHSSQKSSQPRLWINPPSMHTNYRITLSHSSRPQTKIPRIVLAPSLYPSRVSHWRVARITERGGQKHLGERDCGWIYNDHLTWYKRHRFRRNSWEIKRRQAERNRIEPATDPVAKMNVAEDPVRFRMNSLDRRGWTRSQEEYPWKLFADRIARESSNRCTTNTKLDNDAPGKREMRGCGGGGGGL